MNLEDIHKAVEALKALLLTRGFTKGDARIGIHYVGFPLAIMVETNINGRSNIFHGPATTMSLQNLLQQAEAWIVTLPDANEAAKLEFMKTLSGLQARAEELGIVLPVNLAA